MNGALNYKVPGPMFVVNIEYFTLVTVYVDKA